MLDIYAPECFTIGTVANVKQPIAMRRNMVNVPKEGLYNWDPHAQIGIYRPDTFWYRERARALPSSARGLAQP